MRITTIIFTLFLATGLFAQNAKDSLWNSLKGQFDLTEYDRSSERIAFNEDTILIAGYLGNPSSPSTKNVVYKTSDGGKNWKVIEFKGNAWIYDTYHTSDGKIWMGGSDNLIHHSDDFGETWIAKMKPFDPVNRVLSIFMVDSLYGVAGGLSDGLAITYDNWNTSVQIESPIDQRRFRISKQSARDRVNNLAIVDSFIFINQNDYIFYSNINEIDWKKFNIPVSSFQLDEENKRIDLSSRNGKHFVIGSDLELVRTYQEEERLLFTFKKDTTQIDLSEFLKYPINSMDVICTTQEFDRQLGMSVLYKEKIQEANISSEGSTYQFSSEGYETRNLELTKEDLASLLSDNLAVQLNQLSEYFTFTHSDFENFDKILEEEREERKDQDEWGGNFTSEIPIDNPMFKNYRSVTDSINPNYLEAVFIGNDFPFRLDRQANSIKVVFKNAIGEELTISNSNAVFCSLPWRLTYNEKTISTYNQGITELLKTILPKDFSNYEMLLGGQLIYELVEERIIDELKYENVH